MKKLQHNHKQSFTLKPAKFKPSWLIGALLFIQMIIGCGYAQNQRIGWNIGKTPENVSQQKIGNSSLTIEYENFPLYAFTENKIRITSSDKKTIYKVLLPKEEPIEFKGSCVISYKPTAIFTDQFHIVSSKDTIHTWFGIKAMPNPTLFFDSINSNVILREDILKAKLRAKIKGKTCKILHYIISIINESRYSSVGSIVTNQDTTFSKQNRSIIAALKDGDDFYLEDVLLELPDGSKRLIDYKKFKIIKHKYQRNYCNDMRFDKSSYIKKSYCDLRVKIETESLKSKIKIFDSFFEELNKEMNGTKVKLVSILPNITFSNDEYIYETNTTNNFFYPDVRTSYKITQKSNWNFKQNINKKVDIKADEFIEIILNQIGIGFNKSTIIKDSSGYYHLTPLCKEHLNYMYSNGSINRIYKELKVENPNDKTQDYTLIIALVSLILFLIIKESINAIPFTRKLFISKPAFWKSLITYPLLAQIPLVIFLSINYFNDTQITTDFILNAEKYYIAYAILVGIMLWVLDKLQHKIHSFALRLLLDFMATIFIFWAAYQLIFIATHLDYVRLDMLRWQWIYIPLTVAFYRLFNLFMQRKMDQLMQEKELEISKQKEMTTKAELLALQSRINPHFLYNSLNSIASLSATDAKRTEQMAVNLSKLFRYNLNKGDGLMTTIEEELEMVKLYLDIEKQRFGDRLTYRVEIPNELMKYQIPIFLLQPLVENAIKHGISKITESGVIKISIEKSDDRLSIKVFDNGPAFTNEPIHGYGLQNIFDKLTLVYKNNYSMQFVNEPEKYIEIAIGSKK